MNLFDEDNLSDDELRALIPPRPALNEGQQKAFDDIIAFVTGKDKEHPMWVLKGYAGTGKSFTTGRIIEHLHERHMHGGDYRMAVSAPTHKAVRVMKKFSTFPHGAVHYATVHSLLGLKQEIDDHGKEKFVESKDPTEVRINEFNVLFLDETSMLADDLFTILLPHVRRGLKIVFIGDPVQIPPVNHMETIPFKPEMITKYNIGVSELSQIMRQAGENPILGLATAIRIGYKTVPHFQIITNQNVNGHGLVKLEHDDDKSIDEIIIANFVTDEFKADPDHMKIIAYTNKVVDEHNRMVRKRIYAEEYTMQGRLPFIMPGEKLIMDKPLVLTTGRVLLTTNEEIEVMSYEIKDVEIEYDTAERESHMWDMKRRTKTFKHYNAMVSYYDQHNKKVTSNIRILHEDAEKEMKEITEGIATAAKAVPQGSPLRRPLWRSFFDVQRKFAQVKYNYAITAHKSQGSTYNTCLWLDWSLTDIKKVSIEERNRIRYVAITRARYTAYIQR